MNLAVMLRGPLQKAGELGRSVLTNLDDMVTKLTSWGLAEHNDDGSHANVTADSAVIDLASLGRYRNHKIAIWDNAVATDGIIQGRSHYAVGTDPPVAFRDAGVIILINTTGGAGGVPTIYAMDSTGRQNGEVVWFLYANSNTGGGLDANIVTRCTAAQANGFTRFIEDFLLAHTRHLPQGRIAPVMFLDLRSSGINPGSGSQPGWYLDAGVN